MVRAFRRFLFGVNRVRGWGDIVVLVSRPGSLWRSYSYFVFCASLDLLFEFGGLVSGN